MAETKDEFEEVKIENFVEGSDAMELKFTVSNLDNLFFYVDDVSGSGIELLIVAEW